MLLHAIVQIGGYANVELFSLLDNVDKPFSHKSSTAAFT